MKKSIAGVAGMAIAAALVVLSGCQSSGVKVVHGDWRESSAAISRFKALEGQWDWVKDDGERAPGLEISMTADGSAVREIMFPGSESQMTNMYHADGGTLLMTHYCAMGNQPRMRAQVPQEGQPYVFKIDSVTNLASSKQEYMGSMTMTLVDANTIKQEWRHYTVSKGMAKEVTSIMFKRKGT